MTNLNSLIELQKIDFNLDDLKKDIETIGQENEILESKKEKQLVNNSIKEFREELEELDKKIKELDRKLKDNYFNVEDTENKLYSGEIRDSKQLEVLNEELLKLKDETKIIENELIINMEKQEILNGELSKLEKQLNELEKLLGKREEVNSEKKDLLNKSIKNFIERRDEILDEMDEGLIKEYNFISKNRLDFLSKLDGETCTGCNMILPVSLIEKIDSTRIVHCENCNRILYK